jgi:DNA-binding CsgD family transcriptional regulator
MHTIPNTLQGQIYKAANNLPSSFVDEQFYCGFSCFKFTIINNVLSYQLLDNYFEKVCGNSHKYPFSNVADNMLVPLNTQVTTAITDSMVHCSRYNTNMLFITLQYTNHNGKLLLQKMVIDTGQVSNKKITGNGFITDIGIANNNIADTNIDFSAHTIIAGKTIMVLKKILYLQPQNNVLTKRETEVLLCILNGLSSKQIAQKLFLSLNTVNNHRKNIIAKAKTKTIPGLINFATKLGIINLVHQNN